jgi:predicted glycogen debranching enzyme
MQHNSLCGYNYFVLLHEVPQCYTTVAVDCQTFYIHVKPMSYLNFDKTKLINLSYSLNREIIRSNSAGSYACTTIIASNTRKYHGLLVCPLEYLDGGHHVLLSGLHETVIQHDQSFNLGIYKYAGDYYNPKGHKYLRDFSTDPIPRLLYRVGGVILSREWLLAQNEERLLVRYTLEDANSPTIIRLRPYLAFRNIHSLSKANMDVMTKTQKVKRGIKARMYHGYPYLFMQFSKDADFIAGPDWNYNIEYIQEQKRGYDYKEDLFTPGYFELPMKKGESVIFSAGTREADPAALKRKYQNEIKKRIPRNTFHNCLLNAAQQFFVKKEKKTEIMAGFPWYGPRLRDTFGALPGLTQATGDIKTFQSVLDSSLSVMYRNLTASGKPESQIFSGGVDEPLWFFWSLQQYAARLGDRAAVWKSYGRKIKGMLKLYREGVGNVVRMEENGLLYCGETNIPRSWMNCVVEGVPVTPRSGYLVDVNALWYNAIRFSVKLAEAGGDNAFVTRWKKIPPMLKETFSEIFWDEERGYCADYVKDGKADWSVRPNQVFAASMPYSPLNEEKKQQVLEIVRSELLTPKGLRTLSPKNPDYKGIYEGDQNARDSAAHHGTVYPWLLGHYSEAMLRLYKKSGWIPSGISCQVLMRICRFMVSGQSLSCTTAIPRIIPEVRCHMPGAWLNCLEWNS